jgi:hypothetical protein
MDLLGLTDDELCATLDADALTLLSGQLDHRPELSILLALLAEASEQTSPATHSPGVTSPLSRTRSRRSPVAAS